MSSDPKLSALAMTLACIGLAPVFAQQVGTPSGTGPYPAIAESRAELPRHTVYRPVELPPAALPLYVFVPDFVRTLTWPPELRPYSAE